MWKMMYVSLDLRDLKEARRLVFDLYGIGSISQLMICLL